MHWFAPSEKDTDKAAVEKRLWDAAEQAERAPSSRLKFQEYSGGGPQVLGFIFRRFAALRDNGTLHKANDHHNLLASDRFDDDVLANPPNWIAA